MFTWVGFFFSLSTVLLAGNHPAFDREPLVTAAQAQEWSLSSDKVEDWLQKLPEVYRSYFALMYRSASQHASKPEYPRIIFYGPDARLMIGVSTLPTDKHFQIVELIEFNPSSATYHFSTINFALPKEKRVTANALNCNRCHGPSMRPNWEPYDAWPGAFGSVHDTIVAGTEEHRGFRNLLARAGEDKRLAAIQSDLFTNYKELGENQTAYTVTRGGGMNSAFSLLVNFSNRERIAQLLVDAKAPRNAVTAALLDCPQGIDQFAPKGATFKKTFDEVLADTTQKVSTHYIEQLKRTFELQGVPVPTDDEDSNGTGQHVDRYGLRAEETLRVARLRYLLEHRNENPVSMGRWALALDRDAYQFNDGASGLENLIGHYLPRAYSVEERAALGANFTSTPFAISSYGVLAGHHALDDNAFGLENFALNLSNEEVCRRLAGY